MMLVFHVLRNHICRVKTSDSKQYLQWDIAPCGLNDPYPVYMVINPLPRHLHVLWTDKIDLVDYNHVGKAVMVLR